MRRHRSTAAVLLSAGLLGLAGCGEDEAKERAKDAGRDAQDAAGKAGDKAKDAGEDAKKEAEKLRDKAEDAKDSSGY
jgi:hypothetical protein